MEIPLQITFDDVEPSYTLESKIRERAAALERFADHVLSCRVAVGRASGRHQHGGLYRIRIEVGLPGGEVVASRDSPLAHEHADPMVAVRDAFDAVRRQVEDRVRLRRGYTKQHETPTHGRITRLQPYEGYGFVRTPDGLEVYFHRNAVLDPTFDELQIGDEVRFTLHEIESNRAPQASSIRRLGAHRHVEP